MPIQKQKKGGVTMAENQALKRALRAMAAGSKSGFKTFYNSTAAFIYSSARLLYPSHEEACRFMVDVYQYIYLHLPEYDEKQSIEKWISRMIYDRYTQLSIGREPVAPSVSQQMEAGTVILSENERARIWRMLDVQIHFPPEPVKRQPMLRILLVISVLLLALLFVVRYAPAVAQQFTASDQSANQAADDTDHADVSADDTESEDAVSGSVIDENALPDTQTPDDDTATDQRDDQMDELEDQMNQIHTPDTPASASQSDRSDTRSDSSDAQSGSDNSIDALEDLELNLRYGDSLIYADGNTDAE